MDEPNRAGTRGFPTWNTHREVTMSVEVLARKRAVASFRCEGCGLRWRRRLREGPPPGWRRVRAGQALLDLCRGCLAIGVWRGPPAGGGGQEGGPGGRAARGGARGSAPARAVGAA